MEQIKLEQFTLQSNSTYQTQDLDYYQGDEYTSNCSNLQFQNCHRRKSSSFEESFVESSLPQINSIYESQNFTVNLEQQEQSQFQSNLNEDQEENKTNTNALKNIIKSFFNFLIGAESEQLILELVSKKPYQQTIKNIKRYIKCYKFNNQNLIKLIQSKNYSKILEYYLTFDVSEWIYNSKIVDIDKHIQSVNFLKECCVDKSITKKIHTYSKKL
ncbi:hypothetical protein ABPG74_022289 [Tetrahymena malaccensis]